MGLPATAASAAAAAAKPAASAAVKPIAAGVITFGKPVISPVPAPKPVSKPAAQWFDYQQKKLVSTATKIRVAGDATYTKKIGELLTTIAGYNVGYCILSEMSASSVKGKLEIRQPKTDPNNPSADMCKADTHSTDPVKSWQKGETIHDDGHDKVVGTGEGADTYMDFNPYNWDGHTCLAGLKGNGADECLMHELVHANRIMRGLVKTDAKGMGKYGNSEEGIAIIIANMYLSEKGQSSLRGAYTSTGTMSDDPIAFISSDLNFRLAGNIYNQHPTLQRTLVYLPTTFKFNVMKAMWAALTAN
jgi:hypothetical protein